MVTWGNILKTFTIYVKYHMQTALITAMFTSASNLSAKKYQRGRDEEAPTPAFILIT